MALAQLFSAYIRRKKFESQLLAAEMMRGLNTLLGGKPEKGQARSSAAQVKPAEFLRISGAKF